MKKGTFILCFYDSLNVLESFKVEPNSSPGVGESEVLTGVSPAKKAAQQSQGEGMWGLAKILKETKREKNFLSHKIQEAVSPLGEASSCWGVILGVPQGVCPHWPPKSFPKDPDFPLYNKILCLPCITEVLLSREMKVHVFL